MLNSSSNSVPARSQVSWVGVKPSKAGRLSSPSTKLNSVWNSGWRPGARAARTAETMFSNGSRWTERASRIARWVAATRSATVSSPLPASRIGTRSAKSPTMSDSPGYSRFALRVPTTNSSRPPARAASRWKAVSARLNSGTSNRRPAARSRAAGPASRRRVTTPLSEPISPVCGKSVGSEETAGASRRISRQRSSCSRPPGPASQSCCQCA